MVDANKNGIDDSKESNTPLADDQALAGVQTILDKIFATNTDGPTSSKDKSTTRSVVRLDKVSAKALMEAAAQDAGYTGKFTSADIDAFMAEFKAEQDRSIEKTVVSSSGTRVPGATSTATTENILKEQYPSFFEPAQFIKDWIWKKIDFADEKSLGAKALTALSQVRGIVDKFQLLGYSDAEAKIAAKQIAMGKKTLADFTVELQGVAVREYPQFADRFKLDPTLTTYDIASPVINMVAKTLEKDPKDIPMDHPVVLAYTRSAGADGKGQAPSFYDLKLMTKKLPAYQETEEANKAARDGAESLGRALGYGV
jgi:hypothetical protein